MREPRERSGRRRLDSDRLETHALRDRELVRWHAVQPRDRCRERDVDLSTPIGQTPRGDERAAAIASWPDENIDPATSQVS